MANLRRICRISSHFLKHFSAAVLVLSAAFATVTSGAILPVDGSVYGLRIEHRMLGTMALEKGRRGLELTLALHNGGNHGLYDLRLFLSRAGPAALTECEPARLRELPPGASKEVNWTFECLIAPLSRAPLRDVQFRIQAVDEHTQKIVTFITTSQEGR
jgi:hypothetical protein